MAAAAAASQTTQITDTATVVRRKPMVYVCDHSALAALSEHRYPAVFAQLFDNVTLLPKTHTQYAALREFFARTPYWLAYCESQTRVQDARDKFAAVVSALPVAQVYVNGGAHACCVAEAREVRTPLARTTARERLSVELAAVLTLSVFIQEVRENADTAEKARRLKLAPGDKFCVQPYAHDSTMHGDLTLYELSTLLDASAIVQHQVDDRTRHVIVLPDPWNCGALVLLHGWLQAMTEGGSSTMNELEGVNELGVYITSTGGQESDMRVSLGVPSGVLLKVVFPVLKTLRACANTVGEGGRVF